MAARLKPLALALALAASSGPAFAASSVAAPPARPTATTSPGAGGGRSASQIELDAAAAARAERWSDVLASLVALQRVDPQRYVEGRFDYLAARALEHLSRVDEALPRLERYIDTGDLFEVPARLAAARLRFARGDAPLAMRYLLPLLQRRGAGGAVSRAARAEEGRGAGGAVSRAARPEQGRAAGGAVSQRALRVALDALEARISPEALEQLSATRPAASRERRRLLALKAEALDLRGEHAPAAALRLAILAEGKRDDAAALVLSRELRDRATETLADDRLLVLAETARAQRDLPLAQRLLEERLRRAERAGQRTETWGAQFELARLLSGRGKFEQARGLLESILASRPESPRAASSRRDPAPGTAAFFGRVRYNLGATLEKLGLLDEAAAEFARVEAERVGPVGLAIVSRARLEARRGGLGLAERLLALPAAPREPGRVEGLLLLVSLRAEAGDGAGASRALSRVEELARSRKLPEPWKSELPFWRGRAREARGDLRGALEEYASLLSSRPYSAAGQAARERLGRVREAERKAFLNDLRARGERLLAVSPQKAVQHLLPPALLGDTAARDLLSLAYQRLPRHSLVLNAPDFPDERLPALCGDAAACRLLQLGLPQDAEPIVRDARHLDNLTGCVLAVRLAEDAEAGPPALEAAEALARHVPEDFLLELAPRSLRRALAPRPFERFVADASERSGVPADLLYAVMRQESRFDREAASPAAARGLMQLTLPAAGEAARELNEPPPAYLDLYDTGRSIRLGARTLRGLLDRFGGQPAPVAAAYNAGAGQTSLWLAGSPSATEALLASVSYAETRTYLRRVLANRLLYRLSGAGVEEGRALR